MYAVNLYALAELTREPRHLAPLLLLRSVLTETVVRPFPEKPNHDALLVADDVAPERWQAIVTIIRNVLPYHELPLYEKRRGGWKARRQP
jgi:hypothetical protein